MKVEGNGLFLSFSRKYQLLPSFSLVNSIIYMLIYYFWESILYLISKHLVSDFSTV